MKTWRTLCGGLLALLLSSCGIFFAPLEGRWNPLDPDFGEGYTQTSLSPTADGYVDAGMNSYFDGYPTMAAGYSSYLSLCLLKFNADKIPGDVPHAELWLCPSAVTTYAFRVRLIIQDWDPLTITYNQAVTDGFLSPRFSKAVVPAAAGVFCVWDVTELLQSVPAGFVKGLLIETADGMGSVNFQTTEYGTNQPFLRIWTR